MVLVRDSETPISSRKSNANSGILHRRILKGIVRDAGTGGKGKVEKGDRAEVSA
jgi:hypothetical protein